MNSKRQRRKTIHLAVKLKTLGKSLVFSSDPRKDPSFPKQEETEEEENISESESEISLTQADLSERSMASGMAQPDKTQASLTSTSSSMTSQEKKSQKTHALADTLFHHKQPSSNPKENSLSPPSIEQASLDELLLQIEIPSTEISLESHTSLSTHPFFDLSNESEKMLKKILKNKIEKPDGKAFTSQEIDGLEEILKFRQLLSHFASRLTDLVATQPEKRPPILEDLVSEIGQKLEQLEKEDLELSSFSIPWIKGTDQACFEFRKESSWIFAVHNRGPGIEDKELHGEVYLKIGDLIYGKTSVRIQVADSHLIKNEAFLRSLIDLYQGTGTLKEAYTLIKKHFLQTGKCTTEISSKEKQVIEALNQKNATANQTRSLIQELCLEDLCFDTIQRCGTKTNSSLTLPEKWLVSPVVKKYLSLYSFIQHTSILKQTAMGQALASDPNELKKHRWHWKNGTSILNDLAAAA